MSTTDANLSPTDVSLQTNVVTITDNSNIVTGITYVPDSLMITPGQPSTPPPSIVQSDNSFTITLQAGRSNNSAVAASFNSAAGGQFHEYAPTGQQLGETPGELNFYFAVEIQYTTDGDPGSVVVYLGQGSYGSFIDPTNNWWIGGNAVYNPQETGGDHTTLELGSAFLSVSGNQDTFVLTNSAETR